MLLSDQEKVQIINSMQIQQEIPRSQYLHPNFIHGGVRYNIQSSSWKQSKFKSTFDQQQFFTNSDDCSYAILKRSLYCLAPNSQNPMMASLYSYNFVTEEIKEWRADEDTNTPLLRKNYGLVNYDDRICLFGGVNHIQYFNDLVSFCSYSNMWIPVLKEPGIMPEPRIPYVFTEITNNSLLLFGGSNQKGFLKDAFLLKDYKWKQIRIPIRQDVGFNMASVDEIIKSEGIRHCSLKNALYFFGGGQSGRFSNQFYEMKVDQKSLKLVITRIKTDTGPRPCGRVYHGMQKLGQTCFAIYGGLNNSGNLRDITIFDHINQKWTEVHPLNGPLALLSQPKMFYQSRSMYILGNYAEKYGNRKCMVELSFPEFELIKSEICTNCIKRLDYKQKQQLTGPKKPFISNGLIYNMAMQIAFPYQAIALLLDCASILKANIVSIKSQETNNKLSYLDMRFNGIALTKQQYSSIISHSYLQDPIVLQLIDRLKLGAMRLGKTLIYISFYNDLRRVFLFSSDSLIISHYHELYAYFSYEERISDEWLTTQQSANHKKFILNTLKSYFVNPAQVINNITTSSFLIFESNVIMTTEKIYYGELTTTTNDINLCKSRKKVEFLDNLGFHLIQDPEVSLGKYMEYCFLNPPIKSLTVQTKALSLETNKYQKELQKLEASLAIKSLCKEKVIVKDVQAECSLYEVLDTSCYMKDLKGILVYYQGRLINRLDTNFGDLFWHKFFKNRYRKPFSLWSYVGVINFLKGVQPKTMRNQFKNDNFYHYFIRHLKKQYLRPALKTTLVVIDEEEGKANKQVKR